MISMDPIAAKLQQRAWLEQPAQPQQPIAPAAVQEFLPPPPDGWSRLDQKLAAADTPEGQYAQYAEIQRICALPVQFPMDEAEVSTYTRMNVLGDAWDRGFRLMREQAEAVCAYEMVGGGFFPIGVGRGKTLSSMMIANKGYRKGHRKIVLFVPSNVYGQLVTNDIRWARCRVPLSYPIQELGQRSSQARRLIAQSGKLGLYIMPYSLLSTKDAEENLYLIQPSLIILDECQEVANPTAARTQRLNRYIRDHKPEEVAMSGTITHKKIRDYYHIIRTCLGAGCPLPLTASLVTDWGAIIDASAGGSDGTGQASGGSGPLLPLIHWAQRTFPGAPLTEDTAGFRLAYRLRLNHTRGVVVSSDAEIGTSLVVSNRPVEVQPDYPGYQQMRELIDRVELEWRTPNGDELEHAIHKWRWLYELNAGFYNQLTWPTDDTFSRRRGITEQQSHEILQRAMERHEAGQAYAKELRRFIQEANCPGLDTPLLVGNYIYREIQAGTGAPKIPGELVKLWRFYHALNFEGCPDRDSTAIRVCDYKIRAATEWAMQLPKGRGAIIWVWNQEMGEWIYEYLMYNGVNALHCPAGEQSNAAIRDTANANRVCVASIASHGTGKNLQHFQENLMAQWPRNAADAEQMLGRTHRTGQEADSLQMNLMNSTLFDDMNFAACLNDALYIEQTTGTRQKLIFATYDPLPKIFPSSVLYQRGLQNHILTAMQQAALMDRFGAQQ